MLIWMPWSGPSAPRVNTTPPVTKVAPQLVNTWDTAVLLAPDGTLWAWGGSQFQLAGIHGRSVTTQVPLQIGSDSDWRAVAASHMAVLAQKSDGSLWGWGGNGSGQLAHPARQNHPKPVRLGMETNWTRITAGMGHSLALKDDGTLWAWGQNDRGQVGDGTRSNQFALVQIGPDRDWKLATAGAFNSFALKRDGTLWGWGLDPRSGGTGDLLAPAQLDPATNWSSISAGDYCLLAVQADGSLWIWGQNAHSTAADSLNSSATTLTRIGTNTDWSEVHAGQSFFFARKRDGSWWVCGDNSDSQIGAAALLRVGSPQRFSAPLDPWVIAPGFGNTTWLNRDGTLWSLGTRLGSASVQPTLLTQAGNLVNRILGPLLNRPLFRSPTATQDPVPRLIWQLPDGMRQTGSAEK